MGQEPASDINEKIDRSGTGKPILLYNLRTNVLIHFFFLCVIFTGNVLKPVVVLEKQKKRAHS